MLALLRRRRARRPLGPALAALIGAPLLFVVVAVVLDRTTSPQERALIERQQQRRAEVAAAQAALDEPPAPEPVEEATPEPTPEPEPVVAAPEPEPVVTPEPEPEVTTDRSDLQNLAIIAGRSETDPELVAQYARLEALCPPEGPSVGDMAVNLQQLVKSESGRDMDLVDVMRQLATAQEGGAEMGMKCSETGGMLATLLIKGM